MRVLKWVIAAVVLVVIAGGAAFWWFVLRDDAPPRAELRDRDTTTESSAAASDTADGEWTVQPGDEVFVGYRVEEQYAAQTIKSTAAGRTPAVAGTLTITGTTVEAADITADVTQLASDVDRRDNAIKTRGLQTEQFPTATFVLTEPIELGSAPALGVPVTVTAVGDLTLRDVTRSVEIELEARWNGETIDVAGGLPIAFPDYGIEAPTVGGFVTVDEQGEMELQLTFVRA